MSSQQYCTAHFTINVSKVNDDHLIIAVADNDMQLSYSAPSIHFLSHYDDTKLAGPSNYIAKSDDDDEPGICDINPVVYPEVYEKDDASDIAISIGLNT